MSSPKASNPTSNIEFIVQPNPMVRSTLSPVIAGAPSLSVDDWLLPPPPSPPRSRHRIKAYHSSSSNLHLSLSYSTPSPPSHSCFLIIHPFFSSFSSLLHPHFLVYSNFWQSHFIRQSHLSDVQSHFEMIGSGTRKYWMEIYLVTVLLTSYRHHTKLEKLRFATNHKKEK